MEVKHKGTAFYRAWGLVIYIEFNTFIARRKIVQLWLRKNHFLSDVI
jgi:hypothetical protein